MKTSAHHKAVSGPRGKKSPNWRSIVLRVIGIVFISSGVADLLAGKASGRWSLVLERASEPTLFWIYIGGHFLAGLCLLIVPWQFFLSRRAKESLSAQRQLAGSSRGLSGGSAPLISSDEITPRSPAVSAAVVLDKEMSIKCQHCSAEIAADYKKIGLVVDCPTCGARTQLKYETGSRIPPTGWAISFSDFERLLDDESNRKRVAPLIERWFDCEVNSGPEGVSLRKKDGTLLMREHIHEAIQADQERQHQIYQVAMDLWR